MTNVLGSLRKGVSTHRQLANYCEHHAFVSCVEPQKVYEAPMGMFGCMDHMCHVKSRLLVFNVAASVWPNHVKGSLSTRSRGMQDSSVSLVQTHPRQIARTHYVAIFTRPRGFERPLISCPSFISCSALALLPHLTLSSSNLHGDGHCETSPHRCPP